LHTPHTPLTHTTHYPYTHTPLTTLTHTTHTHTHTHIHTHTHTHTHTCSVPFTLVGTHCVTHLLTHQPTQRAHGNYSAGHMSTGGRTCAHAHTHTHTHTHTHRDKTYTRLSHIKGKEFLRKVHRDIGHVTTRTRDIVTLRAHTA